MTVSIEEFAVRELQRVEWGTLSMSALPAGAFVWRDEWESAYNQSPYGPDALAATMQANDFDRARDALQILNPKCDRAAWVKTGMAFHAAVRDFDTFNDWGAGADSYNAQAARATWRSFKAANGGVGAGALFGMARDAVWQDGTASPRPAPAKPAPGIGASEVYVRCPPVTDTHPYITAKRAAGVTLDALRVVPDSDPLRIMGESMAGALVVHCMAADGTLSTLQLIPSPDVAQRLKVNGKPGKLNLPGHSVQDWFTVGELVSTMKTSVGTWYR